MGFEKLKEEIWLRNMELAKSGLVVLTWGNVSGADREAGVMAIKPSGVSYDKLKAEDIVVLSIENGEVIEGSLRPSSDTPSWRNWACLFWQESGVRIPPVVATRESARHSSSPMTGVTSPWVVVVLSVV